jgi:hypothetical protein
MAKCKWCDREVTHEEEHYKDVRDDNDMPIFECSGWTCEEPCGVDMWRERALKAEERVRMLEANLKNLWETTNA